MEGVRHLPKTWFQAHGQKVNEWDGMYHTKIGGFTYDQSGNRVDQDFAQISGPSKYDASVAENEALAAKKEEEKA